MKSLNRRNKLATNYSTEDQRIIGYEKLLSDMFSISAEEWGTQSDPTPEFMLVRLCRDMDFSPLTGA